MEYKKCKNFSNMTINSVPCSSKEYNALMDGNKIKLKKDIAEKMIKMNIIKEVKNGNRHKYSGSK